MLCTKSDATRLISGSCDRTLKIWNVATTECLSTLSEHTDWVSLKDTLLQGTHHEIYLMNR